MKTKSKDRDYAAEYANRPRHSKLCGWYKSSDKKAGRKNDLSSSDVKVLISQPCFWCGKLGEVGLDRKDNTLGHIKTNVVASCYKCNMILGDIPYEGKLLLRDGMHRLMESGMVDNWEPPPFRERENEPA